MSSLLPKILSLLLVYRYAALFVITFVGSLGFPVPAAPSTIAASAFAGQGYLNLFLVMLSGSAGNILGDFSLYWLVRRFGRRVLAYVGLGKIATSPALQNVEATANAYRAPVIILSRFQVQATAIVNVIAGLAGLNFKRFAVLVIIGEVLQMAIYVAIGYIFSDAWESVYAAVGKFSWIIALVLAIVFTVAATKIVKKNFV